MEIINAVGKARFASARPQRVVLHKVGACQIDLLCLEPGQKHQASSGRWTYYVITGSAAVAAGNMSKPLPSGQLAALDQDEPHAVVNTGEGRLVCLAMGQAC